jgi:hypothetical protein
LKGEDAFSELMRWKSGRFETLAVPEELTVSIAKPVEHLLVESMRRSDELAAPRLEGKAGLLVEIQGHVPLPLVRTEELLEFLQKEGKEYDALEQILVEILLVDAFLSPETGEILCAVAAGEEVFIAPLQILKLQQDHPLYEKIERYQIDGGGNDQLRQQGTALQ